MLVGGVLGGDFRRPADGDAQAARRTRMFRQILPPGICFLGGARTALSAPSLHQRLAVGLLLETDAHHVDAHLKPEQGARKGQRRTPLPGAGFGREPLNAGFLVIEGLRHGGVRLVAAGRADALLLFINSCGGVASPAPPAGWFERGGAPPPLVLADALWRLS